MARLRLATALLVLSLHRAMDAKRAPHRRRRHYVTLAITAQVTARASFNAIRVQHVLERE